MRTEPCPSARELEDHLLGRLPPGRAAAVGRHLDGCAECPARVDALQVESRLMRVLAGLPPAGVPDDAPAPPGLRDLMARLESLVPSHAGDTPNGEGTDDTGFPFLGPPQGPDELGRLGGYRVLKLLRSGGMGYVFLAEDTDLERRVGLKVLRPRADRDPAARARFLREARAMAAVKHDHIAVLHQVGVTAGSPDGPGTAFLAMELLDGASLHAWMKENPRPPVAWAVRIARQAADGLAAAHAVGLIHRDVKTSNLWLEAPAGWRYDPPAERPPLGAVGRVKLIDFGLVASSGPAAGDGPNLLGTPGYMAPELFRGGPPGVRSDLFALGCVLYELCAGDHPFPGRGLRTRPGFDAPAPALVRDFNPAVPPALAALVGRLLADDPAARPASARDVARELAELEAGLAGPRTTRRWRTAAAGVAVMAAAIALLVTRPRADPAPSAVAPVAAAPPSDEWPADRLPFPAGPPDDLWCRRAADLPPKEQFRVVSQKLEELNPGHDSRKSTGWIEPETVIRITVPSDVVRDLRPIRGMPDVKAVSVFAATGTGRLTGLGPLAGLGLKSLDAHNNPDLRDFTPLRGLRLFHLNLSHTGLDSLAPVAGDLLKELLIAGTAVRDLGPVRSMPRLQLLDCAGCPVASFEPLAGSGVVDLRADLRPDRDGPLLRRMPKLQKVNGRPVQDFLRNAGAV